MEFVYLNPSHFGFEADIKTFPEDFKVTEIDDHGNLCCKAMCELQDDICTDLLGKMNRTTSACLEDEHSHATKKRKLNDDSTENSWEPEICNISTDWCEQVLRTLIASKSEELKDFASNALKITELKPLCVGKFSNKIDRTNIHISSRYLYPQLQSSVKEEEIFIKPCPIFQSFCKLLGEEEASSFIQFAFTHAKEKTQHRITGSFDKNTRRLIHFEISAKFGKILMSKTKNDGKVIEVLKKFKKKRKCDEKIYHQFTLHKKNMETLLAVHQLADHYKLETRQLSYAGMKDKHAETWQRLRVEGITKAQLEATIDNLPSDLSISDITLASSPLRVGDLSGNRFIITLRNIKAVGNRTQSGDDGNMENAQIYVSIEQSIEQALENVKTQGFVNYFGSQRFGKKFESLSPDMMLHQISSDNKSHSEAESLEASSIGLSMLKGDMKSAILKILLPVCDDDINSDDVTDEINVIKEAKCYFSNTGDIAGTIKKLPRHRIRELGILRSLRRFGASIQEIDANIDSSSNTDADYSCSKAGGSLPPANAYTKALQSIPYTFQSFYPHAYFSFVWNMAVTERFRRFGFNVTEGDLVMAKDQKKTKEVHVVTSHDISQRRFPLEDVVLPLPGNRVIFPPNMELFYRRVLECDGVVPIGGEMGGAFTINQLKINISVAYRKIIAIPKNLEFKWNSVECVSAVSSNCGDIARDLSSESGKVVGSNPDQSGRNLTLKFDLPSSCYATTFLQQLSRNGIHRKSIRALMK